MENGPPPLPESRPVLVTLTGAVGLVLVALSAAAASSLQAGSLLESEALRLLISNLGTAIGFLGVGFSLVADRKANSHRIVFILAFVLGVGAIGFNLQAMITPGKAFVAEVKRELATATAGQTRFMKKGTLTVPNPPIPTTGNKVTRDTIEPLYRSWIDEKLRKAYDAHGEHNPKWDQAARDFTTGSLIAQLGLRGAPDAPALDALATQLQHTGCDDPLVLYFLALRQPETRRRVPLESATGGLANKGYPMGVLFLARTEIWSLRLKNNPQSAADSVPGTIANLRDELAGAPLGDRDYWVWNYFFTNGACEKFIERNGDAVLAALDPLPTIEPWFKHRLRGGIEVAKAWQARGSGWASTVTESGWAGFREHLGLARDELTEAWQAHPQHPAAAQQMIRVTMGQSGPKTAEEMRQWFDRAVSARFDFMPAYGSLLWGLRPRWFGSEEAVLNFGKACAETKRYDTGVPWEYFVAARDAASDWDEPEAFYRRTAPYAELRALCLAYTAEAKAPEPPAFYLSHLALLAANCGHRDDALGALAKIDFKLHPIAAAEWKVDAKTWAGHYAAYSGPIADRLREADQAESHGDFNHAAEILEQAGHTSGLDTGTRQFLIARAKALEGMRALQQIAWEPFLPPLGDAAAWKAANWVGVRGKWAQPDAQTLELQNHERYHSLVHSTAPAGETYELRGEIEFLPGDSETTTGAITLGWPEDLQDVWLSVGLQHSAKGDKVVFGHSLGIDRTFPAPASSGRSPFLVCVVGHHISVSFNGTLAMDTDFRPPGDVSGWPPVLGFGLPRNSEKSAVRFHHVEWRRLPSSDAPR